MTQRGYLFAVTAVLEGGTGLALLVVPALPIALLLGADRPAPEALLVGRVAGVALLALAVACWAGRGGGRDPARLGLSLGVLLYDVGAAALLAWAGVTSATAGVGLWPAVVLHLALSVWCVVCLSSERNAS